MERAIFSPVSLLETTRLQDIPTWNQSCQQLRWLRGSETEASSSCSGTTTMNPPAWGECLSLVLDDITTLQVDYIVNPSNHCFSAGGGLNGVIHRKAGPKLAVACRAKAAELLVEPDAATGKKILVTPGFDLPCQSIIHVDSPSRMDSQDELKAMYMQLLNIAAADAAAKCTNNNNKDSASMVSIALPNIGCGSHMIDPRVGAETAVAASIEWWQRKRDSKSNWRIIFCCWEESDLLNFRRLLQHHVRNEVNPGLAMLSE